MKISFGYGQQPKANPLFAVALNLDCFSDLQNVSNRSISKMITVTEYAELQSYQKTVVTDKAANTVIASRRAYISQETLDWIVDKYQAPHTDETEQIPVLDDVRRNSFKLGAYVGYIQSPFTMSRFKFT